MKLSKHRDGGNNPIIAKVAGDLAWGAIKGYHQARDTSPLMTAIICYEVAFDICIENGGRLVSDDDPAGDIALEILNRFDYHVTSGTLGFDAVITKTN